MDIGNLKTDLDAANTGAWFPFGEDAEVKIAMWGNKKHKKFLREIFAKHGRKIEAKALSDAQADKLLLPQWKYIVKDWRGLEDDGVEVPFSEDVLAEWLQDKSLAPFFDKIGEVAKEEENFRAKNIEEMGNE